MTGEGKVISVDGLLAVVEIRKSSACGHDCASCGACTNPSYTVTVQNPVSACPGDVVSIETLTGEVLKNCFVLYILPVIFMICASIVSEIYDLGMYGIFVYVILLGLWFALIRYRNKAHIPSDVISAVIKKG